MTKATIHMAQILTSIAMYEVLQKHYQVTKMNEGAKNKEG